MLMPKAYEGKEPYIFISYAHKDSEKVIPIITALQSRGFRVWYDEGLEVGSSWGKMLADYLYFCTCTICFISQNFLNSQNCHDELYSAKQFNKSPLIIYLEDFIPDREFQFNYGRFHALKYTDFTGMDHFMDKLSSTKILLSCKEEKSAPSTAMPSAFPPNADVICPPPPIISPGNLYADTFYDEEPGFPLDLLDTAPDRNSSHSNIEQHFSALLAEALSVHRLAGRIIRITAETQIIQCEIAFRSPNEVTQLLSFSDSLKQSIGCKTLRITPSPDAKTIAVIELPNPNAQPASLRELLEDDEFLASSAPTTAAFGTSINGQVIVRDIAALSHLLIGGNPQPNKDAWFQAMILSAFQKATQEQIRFIMIDSPQKRLAPFHSIANLMLPILDDAPTAVAALKWVDSEATRRKKLLEAGGHQNILSLNTSAQHSANPLPHIIVVIDELSVLMQHNPDDTEMYILRIAQYGHATGIHLIVATESLNIDTLSGIVTSMLPARIAFATSTREESRLLLDCPGAENLLESSDFLFKERRLSSPLRIQGCCLSKSELQNATDYLRRKAPVIYNKQALNEILNNKASTPTVTGGILSTAKPSVTLDPRFAEAVEAVLNKGNASTSLIQRKLSVGFSRASQILDQLEEHGIIGPYIGPSPRELLIDQAQWDAMKHHFL